MSEPAARSVNRSRIQWAHASWLVAPALVAIATIALVFRPLSPPYDLAVFRGAGHALLHGLPVYPKVGMPTVYSGSAFVYPYFAAWAFAPLAFISLGLGAGLFFVFSAGAVTLAVLAVADRTQRWSAVLVLCASFTISGLQLGALSPLLFAGAIFLWKLRDRPLAFAALAAPVIACKLFLAPLLLWPLLAGRRRAFGYALGALAGLLAASFVLSPLGPIKYQQLLSALSLHEARAGFGMVGALMNIGLPSLTAQAISIIAAIAVLGLSLLGCRRTHDERVLFYGGIVASLVASPIVWSHYLVVLFAALLVARVQARWLLLAVLASWAIAPPHGQHLDTDFIGGIASSGTWSVVVAASVVLMVSSPQRVRRGKDRAT